MEKSISLTKAVFILILAGLITSIATLYFLSYFQPFTITDIDMFVTVGNTSGFNIDNTSLFFGTVIRGGSGTRNITVTNNADNTCNIMIEVIGQLSDWSGISENTFMLKKNERKSIKIDVTAPENAAFGDYTGILRIITDKECLS